MKQSLKQMQSRMETVFHKKLHESRVLNEAGDLAGQALAGTVLKSLGRMLAHLLFIWGAIVLLQAALDRFWPGPDCVQACFMKTKEACCALAPLCLMRVLICFLTLTGMSFLCTRFAAGKKFQHSAMVTVGVMGVFSALLPYLNFPAGLMAAAYVLIFLGMFLGYRLAVVRR